MLLLINVLLIPVPQFKPARAISAKQTLPSHIRNYLHVENILSQSYICLHLILCQHSVCIELLNRLSLGRYKSQPSAKFFHSIQIRANT